MKSILTRTIFFFLCLSHQSLGFWEPDWDDNDDFFSCFLNLRYRPVAINVDTAKVEKITTPTPLLLTVTKFDSMAFVNSGQSIQTVNTMESIRLATGGLLQGSYTMLSFNYYWTKTASGKHVGTTIDGKGYPFEVRVVWKNTKYITIAEAVKQKDGLMELLFVYEMCPTLCKQFSAVIENMKRIRQAGTFTLIPILALTDASNFMVPDTEYYTYMGSYEDTTTNHTYKSSRVIFPKPTARYCITEQQFIEAFGNVKNFCGEPYENILTHNPGYTPVSMAQGIEQNLYTCV